MSSATSIPAVGESIAIARKAQGLTQAALAHQAGVSVSLLSKVEIGDRPASHAVVAAVAKALHTTPSSLYRGGADPAGPDLGPVRAALRRYNLPGDAEGIDPCELAGRVQKASDLRAATAYNELVEMLPDLIDDAVSHAYAADDPVAWTTLNDVLGSAHGAAYRLGHHDLAEVIAARQEWAASRTWNPLAQAVASGQQASAHQAAGDFGYGVAACESAITVLSSANLTGREAVIVRGTLHLRAAAMAAHLNERASAVSHLHYADGLAEQIHGPDQTAHNLLFGSANVALHRLAAYVTLDEPDEAATMLDEGFSKQGLTPTRLGHLHVDAARAHLALGDRDAALAELRKGDEVAPQMVSVHPMAREVGRVLVSTARRSNPDLVEMALRLGVDF